MAVKAKAMARVRSTEKADTQLAGGARAKGMASSKPPAKRAGLVKVADQAASVAAIDEASWATVKTQYADRSLPVAGIASAIGMTAYRLTQEAKARGWLMRSDMPRLPKVAKTDGADADGAVQKAAAAKNKTASKPPKPDVLLQHVFGTIEGELKKLDSHKGASSQDRERASRALTQMVNSLEKAVEMQRDITKAKSKGRGAKDREALAHADDLRREIAERIEKLQRKRTAQRSAE